MIDELYLLAEIMGIKITEMPNLHQTGRWNHTTRTIQLCTNLTTSDKTATLAHELIHVRMGHQGRQTPSMETKVDQLELPAWIIKARQATFTQHNT